MSFRETVIAELDQLEVPECDLRRITLALVDMLEQPDRPGHVIAANRAIEAILPVVRDLYEPRPPLRQQVDYMRARRLAAVDGIELPPWEAVEDR